MQRNQKKTRYFSAYVLPPPLVVCLPLVSWTDETSGAERLSQNQRSTNEWCLSSQKKKYKKWWFWCMSPSEALLSIVLLQINSRLVWTSVQLCTRSRSSLASLAPLVRQVPWALLRVWPSAPLIWKKMVSGCHLDLSEFWTAYSARCSICAKQRLNELEMTKSNDRWDIGGVFSHFNLWIWIKWYEISAHWICRLPETASAEACPRGTGRLRQPRLGTGDSCGGGAMVQKRSTC